MIHWNKINTSKEDLKLIIKISKRYIRTIPLAHPMEMVDIQMDLTCTHFFNPLRLHELEKADDFNFYHDVNGIRKNLNRETGELENCFLPRFTK